MPRRGIYIIRKSKRQIIEMIQMWAALESMAARLATLHAPDAEIAKLRHLFDEFQNSPPSEHLYEYSDANIAFHTDVIRLGGSQTIIDATRNLLLHVRAIRRATITQSDRAARSIIDHLKIIEALERRDTELAERLTRQHTLDLAAHVDRILRFSRLALRVPAAIAAGAGDIASALCPTDPVWPDLARRPEVQRAIRSGHRPRQTRPAPRRAALRDVPGSATACLQCAHDRPAPLARRRYADRCVRCAWIGEIDLAEFLDAALQEPDVVLGRQQVPVGIEGCGRARVDVDAPEALDVQQPIDVQHVERVVVAEGDGTRQLAELHAVVQELEVDPTCRCAAPR